MYQPRKIVSSLQTTNIFVDNHLFILEWGHCRLTRNFHEEYHNKHCDLPSTYLVDEFAFKNHS